MEYGWSMVGIWAEYGRSGNEVVWGLWAANNILNKTGKNSLDNFAFSDYNESKGDDFKWHNRTDLRKK